MAICEATFGAAISVNVPAYLEDQLYLKARLSTVAGAQAIFAERRFIDEFLTNAEGNQIDRISGDSTRSTIFISIIMLFIATIGSLEFQFIFMKLYESPFGFYAGLNLECNLSRYPVDEANTLFADSYLLLGYRAGFQRTNGFSAFIDCKNLTNQRYASSIDVIALTRTEPNPEIFHPGDGRSIYGGVSWTW